VPRVSLVFPHQLIERSPILKKGQPVYLVEESLFFKEFSFHKQKLVFHRASMMAYRHWLLGQGYHVIYVEAHTPLADVRFMIAELGKSNIRHIDCIDPIDDWLSQRIANHAAKAGIGITWHGTPLFLNSPHDLKTYFRSDKKKFFQTEFYINQRKSLNILINVDGVPHGGKWSFDADNRKRYPAHAVPPVISLPQKDAIYEEAMTYISKHFPAAPGACDDSPRYPYTFECSRKWLGDFVDQRLRDFGKYEDAIVAGQEILHHSVLTPMLNVGLLTPQEVVDTILGKAHKRDIPVNSLEGFIRQVIGWREFIRGMYVTKGAEQRKRNHWGFERPIPRSFYNGTTGIPPVDVTIRKVLKTGYCHHIERLMVLGNFMFLCGFHPDAVYRWFMELFIDAYDWVMVPNIYGMSQFADGGMMATKPYISGSNYILKMSDYKRGDWCQIWDALYWTFIQEHQQEFSRNPRMSMMVRQLEKMDSEKLLFLKKIRDQYLQNLTGQHNNS